MTDNRPAARPAPAALSETDDEAAARPRLAVALASVILAAALSFLASDFFTFQLTLALTYALAVLGLDLLTGFTGQFSLGHSAFFAVGAYVAAILMESVGLPYYAAVPVAGLACFAFGVLFGLPALRLEAVHLALATFALGIAMPQVLKSSLLSAWTGGVQGIAVTRPAAPFGLPLSPDRWLYLVTLAVTAALFACAHNLVRSRSGRAMIAIRDNPTAARAMGINVALYKTLTFGVSSLYAGIGGALAAIAVQFVAPDSFTFTLSIGLFVGLVVGGVGSIGGALFGGLFVLFVPNIAESISKGLAGAAYGAILLLVIYLMPSGAAGLARRLVAALSSRHRNDHGKTP